jgi:hypothetical protein
MADMLGMVLRLRIWRVVGRDKQDDDQTLEAVNSLEQGESIY